MVLEKIRNKIEKKEEEREQVQEEPQEGSDYLEITEDQLRDNKKIGVRIENLKDYLDIDRIQHLVRDGNVIFLRIKDLRSKDIAELKRAVDKLRKTCTAMNGDMVGVDEDFLVITPQFAGIYRGRTGGQ